MIRDLIDEAAKLGTLTLLALAFGLGFGEAAIGLDLLVPGEVGMVLMGATADAADIALPYVIVAGACGAIAGDSFSYFLGRAFGLRIVHRFKWMERRLQQPLERAHTYFHRRGGVTVFVARWIGALRAVVPVIAGASKMPYWQFLAWDVAAAALWTTTVVSLGYFLGDDIADLVDRIGLGISLAVVGALLAVYLFRRWHRSRSESTSGDHR